MKLKHYSLNPQLLQIDVLVLIIHLTFAAIRYKAYDQTIVTSSRLYQEH